MFQKLEKLLADRRVVGGILLGVQAIVAILLVQMMSDYLPWVYTVCNVLSYIMVIWLVRKYDNPAYKTAWIIVIILLPLFGGLFYLFWGNTPFNARRHQKKYPLEEPTFDGAADKPATERMRAEIPRYRRLSEYVASQSGMPVWKDTAVNYYPTGEGMFAAMLEDMKQAKHFIFLEYFIIEEGIMWNAMLHVLQDKIRQGCDVRVIYDDVGSIATLPRNYDKFLRDIGVKVVRFNRFTATLNTYFNYRDHRKILVIDGNIGYMGGINLADEYINEVVRFGYWKDTGVRLVGVGVANITEMFLKLWAFSTGTHEDDHAKFQPTILRNADSFVQPFDDCPLDDCNVGETAFMQIIARANHYVYITTPYLILDNEMVTTLISAAQSGVDVRIITPGIPDKKLVYMVTRSYYQQLTRAGVKIYEYSPGFLHAKMIISDDSTAIVGTINMDFRSFFMHFECGTLIYGGSVIGDIRKDVEDMIGMSRRIDEEWFRGVPWIASVVASVLRLLAPML